MVAPGKELKGYGGLRPSLVSEVSESSANSDEEQELAAEDTDWELVNQVKMQNIHKRHQFTPQANLYKCWSINLFKGRPKLLLFTYCVVLIQILAPLFLFGYARRQFRERDVVNGWVQVWNTYDRDRSNTTLYPNSISLIGWVREDDEALKFFQLRILGVLFMVVIFLQNDEALLELDMTSNNFQKIFPRVGCFANFVDTWCNCVCMTIVGLAVGPVFEACDTVGDLILNAVGLLFLSNIDDFATSGINYGYDVREFDEIVDEFRKRHLRELAAVDNAEKETLTLTSHVCSFFRLVNFVMAGIQLPVFLILTMDENPRLEAEVTNHWFANHIPGFAKLAPLWRDWLPYTVLLLVAWMAMKIFMFVQGYLLWQRADEDSKEMEQIRSHYQVMDFDIEGFLSNVVMRRPDPRYQFELSRQIARRELMEEESGGFKLD